MEWEEDGEAKGEGVGREAEKIADKNAKLFGGKRCSFQKGNKAAAGRKGKGKPQVLRDMQHVYTNDKSKDRTRAHKDLRELYEQDRDKFIGRLTAMERTYLQSVQKKEEVKAAQAEEKDEGYDRVMELIDRWLAEREARGKTS